MTLVATNPKHKYYCWCQCGRCVAKRERLKQQAEENKARGKRKKPRSGSRSKRIPRGRIGREVLASRILGNLLPVYPDACPKDHP